MSFNIYIHDEEDNTVYDRRVTGNNWPIFKFLEIDFEELNGLSNKEVAGIALKSFIKLLTDRISAQEFDPPNGWGGCNDVHDVLINVVTFTYKHPDGTFHYGP